MNKKLYVLSISLGSIGISFSPFVYDCIRESFQKENMTERFLCLGFTAFIARMSLLLWAATSFNNSRQRVVTAFVGSYSVAPKSTIQHTRTSSYWKSEIVPCSLLSSSCYNLPVSQKRRDHRMEIGESSRLFATTTSMEELNEKLKEKGDEIRQLKADGIDKEALAPHIEELLMLKGQLPADESPKKETKSKKKNKNGNKPKKQQNNSKKEKPPVEMTESEIKLNRLAKIDSMREAGVEPFEYTFAATTSAAQLTTDYNGKLEPGEEDEESDVAVAGRIMVRRVFGKLAFFTMQDESGIVQLQFDKNRLGDNFKVGEIRKLISPVCLVRSFFQNQQTSVSPKYKVFCFDFFSSSYGSILH